MCQLLGMNANTPTDVCFSFAGLATRADEHKDGFGIAFFEDRGLQVTPAAGQSPIRGVRAAKQAVCAHAAQGIGTNRRTKPRSDIRLPGLPFSSSTALMRRRMRGLLRARQISRSASQGWLLTLLARS